MEGADENQIGMVLLLGCRCRCGHEWLPRGDEKPRVCPKCKSPNWDRPKRTGIVIPATPEGVDSKGRND
jgi:predicted Zn-ribbon and HTH transcriptional regulator